MVHLARRPRAVRTALLTAAAAGLVAAGLVAPLQAAADSRTASPEPVEPDLCEGALTLSEADRLAGNCLPGNDIARLLQQYLKLDMGLPPAFY